jgi:hypothetical protein
VPAGDLVVLPAGGRRWMREDPDSPVAQLAEILARRRSADITACTGRPRIPYRAAVGRGSCSTGRTVSRSCERSQRRCVSAGLPGVPSGGCPAIRCICSCPWCRALATRSGSVVRAPAAARAPWLANPTSALAARRSPRRLSAIPACVGSGVGCCWCVDPLEVAVEHSPGAEGWCEGADRSADACEPGAREPFGVAVIEGGHNLPLD